MINNSSYLTQAHSFKYLRIRNKTAKQMALSTNSFYKFSKAKTLHIETVHGGYFADDSRMTKTFDAALKLTTSCSNRDEWFTNACKTIKNIVIDKNGIILLRQVPINILFGAKQSAPETIELAEYNVNSMCRSCKRIYKMY